MESVGGTKLHIGATCGMPLPTQGLKSHAVTMFEVGKLADEALDSFLTELDRVSTTTYHFCTV